MLINAYQQKVTAAKKLIFKHVCKIAKSDLALSCLSIHSEQLGSCCTDFYVIWYLWVFLKYVRKIWGWLKFAKNNGCFTLRLMCFFMSHWIFLRMGNVSDRFVEKIKTLSLCLIIFFFPESGAVYEIMWKDMVESGRPQMTI